jgi:hypothetical protein
MKEELPHFKFSRPIYCIGCDMSLSPQSLFNILSLPQTPELPYLIMPATCTTKMKAFTTPLDAKTTKPVKKPCQHKARNTVNSSIPADTMEHAISMAPAGGQKSCKKAAAPTGDTDVAIEESQPEAGKCKHQLTSDTQEESDNLPLK